MVKLVRARSESGCLHALASSCKLKHVGHHYLPHFPRPQNALNDRLPQTRDLTGQLIVLGSGTSVGVPAIGCGCAVCGSTDPKNHRTRCAVILGLPEGNLLIDTPPDLRFQLLREGIGIVHAVGYTHEHTDHLMGLDDLRLMQFYLGKPVPIYCQRKVEDRIRSAFAYAFDDGPDTHPGATPKLEFRPINVEPFTVLGTQITPLPLLHGPHFTVLGFRVGNVAYCTDTSEIPPQTRALMQGLDVLILDGLRHRPHPTHLSVEQAMTLAEELQVKQTYLTHICHELDHEETNAHLPAHVQLAYDGLVVPLD